MKKGKEKLEIPDNLVIVEVNRGLVEGVYTNINGLNVHILDKDLDVVCEKTKAYNETLAKAAKQLKKVSF